MLSVPSEYGSEGIESVSVFAHTLIVQYIVMSGAHDFVPLRLADAPDQGTLLCARQHRKLCVETVVVRRRFE